MKRHLHLLIKWVGADSTTVTGTTQVTGNWTDGTAREGDGSDDYIQTTTLGNYGSNMPSGFAVGITIKTTSSSGFLFGSENNVGGENQRFRLFLESDGTVTFDVCDASKKFIQVNNNRSVNDGSKHRIVISATDATDASSYTTYTDQTEYTTAVKLDESPSSDFDNLYRDFILFARNNNPKFGGISNFYDGVIDDLCLFNDGLTEGEATSYNNPF